MCKVRWVTHRGTLPASWRTDADSIFRKLTFKRRKAVLG